MLSIINKCWKQLILSIVDKTLEKIIKHLKKQYEIRKIRKSSGEKRKRSTDEGKRKRMCLETESGRRKQPRQSQPTGITTITTTTRERERLNRHRLTDNSLAISQPSRKRKRNIVQKTVKNSQAKRGKISNETNGCIGNVKRNHRLNSDSNTGFMEGNGKDI